MEHIGRFERALADPATFTVTWEIVPGRGAVEASQADAIAMAEQAAAGRKVHAVSITDNPGGGPAISAEMLGAEIVRLGIEPLVHFTCKDKNRNQMESLLYGLERAQVRNLLVMTGDYPKGGFGGQAKPVFDLDPTMVLDLVTAMNRGLEVPGPKAPTRLSPAHFVAGAACSPFKAVEAEQMGQYYKLKKKLESGARFIVAQLGFDARKFEELLMTVKQLGYGNVPVLGNIYVLSLGAAKTMHRGALPGCVVTERLLETLAREAGAKDKGKSARLERAAKMYALLKGLGFAGTHIGGHGVSHDEVVRIIERGEELAPAWRELVPEFDLAQPGGWYAFERDAATGLNTGTPVSREGSAGRGGIAYSAMRAVHRAAFEPKGPLFRPLRAVAKAVDGSPLERPFTAFEHVAKGLTNDCQDCGDCALADTAYLCPMAGCAKNQRNGPCGGSRDGWCESFPGERRCFYVRVYERLHSHGAEETLGAYHIAPRNEELAGTSSWLNFYLGRDHSAERLGIVPPAPVAAPAPTPAAAPAPAPPSSGPSPTESTPALAPTLAAVRALERKEAHQC